MKLRTAADVKLERLKFAILFTIVDMCSVKTKINARYQKIQKIRNKSFIHSSFTHLLSFTLVKTSFTLG